MFQPRRWLLISTFVTLVALFGQPHPASAQNPATLHMGPGFLLNNGDGPVELTGGNTVTVQRVGSGTPIDSQFQLFLGVPNPSSTPPTITSITANGTTTSTSVAGALAVSSFSSGDAYGALGLGASANNSQQFVNWQTNDQQFAGFAPGTPTSYGIFSYAVPTGITLLAGNTDSFTFSSGLPVGSYIFAFGVDASSGVPYSTAFTNTGLTIPEPGPLLGAGVVTLIGLGYTWRRRRQATA